VILALKVGEADNVATVFAQDVKAGDEIEVRDKKGNTCLMKAKTAIPYGHKIALCPIAKGQDIMKYGERIGVASKDIEEGCHVHIHNLDSMRGRGDLEAKGEQA
jgi:altronate dehydratase small subunit